jgi:hypothetical protein
VSHVRTQIRQALVAALVPLGHPVYASRVYPVALEELPVLLVYSGGEEIEGDFTETARSYTVVVEAIATGADHEDTLDGLLVGIEKALPASLSLIPTQIEVSASAEGSTPIGRLIVTLVTQYRTSYTDPETPM